LSETSEGEKHDKKLADEQEIPFPPGSKLWQGTGFQGYQQQKEHNQVISMEHIWVEHSLGGGKVFGIVRQIFRNMRVGFDDLVIETACGLHNLRGDFSLIA